jgi:multiple sugar transport system substrate-binding protein
MKRSSFIFTAAVALIAGISFAACSKSGSSPSSSAAAKTAAEPVTITFWYNNTGDEAKVYEKAIAAYNASQTKYKVEGLSVNDSQKVIVAISGNQAPDLIKGSNSDVISYALNGLISPLKSFVDQEKFDTGIYSDASIAANTVDGQLYALPLTGYSIQLFYNKDLLKAAGYTDPPTTVEQMFDMGMKATQVDAQGNITVLGYPIAPLTAARQELIYAWGGRWWASDRKTLTPQDPNIIKSLEANVQFRKKFGIDKVYAYVNTANTNRYTANDVFFTGHQLFRLDGPWLPKMMANFKSTVNWGIALIPSPASDPSARGTCRFETDSMYIPVTSAHKDAAWDFMKWLSGPVGAKIIDVGVSGLPALKALYTDPDVTAQPGFSDFVESLKLEKGIQYPTIKSFAEYTSMINEQLDFVYAGKKTPQQAMADLADSAKTLD